MRAQFSAALLMRLIDQSKCWKSNMLLSMNNLWPWAWQIPLKFLFEASPKKKQVKFSQD